MPVTAPPILTSPPPVPTRADPVTFAARGDAFLSWLPTAWTNLSSSMSWIYTAATEIFASANSVQADRITCSAAAAVVTAQSPIANAALAQASAIDAASYASTAQATNPDSPIRLNPREITTDFTIDSKYNAFSAGPMHISSNAVVHIIPGATWTVS